MNARALFVGRPTVLLAFAALFVAGCGWTSRETVLSSETLNVVAVTRSTLDINESRYRYYTTYVLYMDGEPLPDKAFAALLQDSEVSNDQFVHDGAVVLADDSVLLSSHNREGARCWVTRLTAAHGKFTLQRIIDGSTGCEIRPAPRGWRELYDAAGNLVLVREHPFKVFPIAGYWYVLSTEGDVAALYQKDREQEQWVVRLVQISSGTTLAEQVLPLQRYAEPDLLHASPEKRRQWLSDNFTVVTTDPASVQLRADHRLETITPEVWAQYQQIDRENKEADARAVAAGQARLEAQRSELLDAEAARQRTGE